MSMSKLQSELQKALDYFDTKVILKFVRDGYNFNTSERENILRKALIEPGNKFLEDLLANGFDLNAKDEFGNSLFAKFISQKNIDLKKVKKLLSIPKARTSIDFFTKNNNGDSIFHLIAKHLEIPFGRDNPTELLHLLASQIKEINGRSDWVAMELCQSNSENDPLLLTLMRNPSRNRPEVWRELLRMIPMEDGDKKIKREEVFTNMLLQRNEKNRFSLLTYSSPDEFNKILGFISINTGENLRSPYQSRVIQSLLKKAILSKNEDNLIVALVKRNDFEKINTILRYFKLPELSTQVLYEKEPAILRKMPEILRNMNKNFPFTESEKNAIDEDFWEKKAQEIVKITIQRAEERAADSAISGTGEDTTGLLFRFGKSEALRSRFDTEKAKLSKAKQESPQSEPLLEYGPLPKSKYTRDLEKLVRYGLQKLPTRVKKINNDYIVTVTVGERRNKTEETFNLSQILKFANMQHVQMNENDLKLYKEYLKAKVKSKHLERLEKPEDVGGAGGEANIRKNDVNGSLADVKYPEMQAIHLYAGDYYTPMNSLLRGKFDNVKKNGKKQDFVEMLVHSAVAVSALNKIPDTTVETAYRFETVGQSETEQKKRKDRLEKVKQGGGVTYEYGFVSTSFDKPYDITQGDTFITFQGQRLEETVLVKEEKIDEKTREKTFELKEKKVRQEPRGGLIGKDIHLLAKYSDEREFLFPPGQVMWTGYIQEKVNVNGIVKTIDYFLARQVRTLTNLPKEALELEENINLKTLNLLVIDLYIYLESITRFAKKLSRDPKTQNLAHAISTSVSQMDKILNEENINPADKLKAIEAETTKMIESLQKNDIQKQELKMNETLNDEISGHQAVLDEARLHHSFNMNVLDAIQLGQFVKKNYKLSKDEIAVIDQQIQSARNCLQSEHKLEKNVPSLLDYQDKIRHLENVLSNMNQNFRKIIDKNKTSKLKTQNETVMVNLSHMIRQNNTFGNAREGIESRKMKRRELQSGIEIRSQPVLPEHYQQELKQGESMEKKQKVDDQSPTEPLIRPKR